MPLPAKWKTSKWIIIRKTFRKCTITVKWYSAMRMLRVWHQIWWRRFHDYSQYLLDWTTLQWTAAGIMGHRLHLIKFHQNDDELDFTLNDMHTRRLCRVYKSLGSTNFSLAGDLCEIVINIKWFYHSLQLLESMAGRVGRLWNFGFV